jgi:Kdo2-lipid IVA lauroyltransferase/acyltransferase
MVSTVQPVQIPTKVLGRPFSLFNPNFSKLFRLPRLSLSKFLQLRLNTFLFRLLPFAISRWYIASLGKLYYLLNWQEKRLIRKTIHKVFQGRVPARTLRNTVQEAFRGIFDHYHEKLFMAYSNFSRLVDFLKTRVHFQGEEELLAALAEGKGVILVTGHYGAVEFLPGALAARDYPTSMICRFQTHRLRVSLCQRAEYGGLNLIDADEGNIILASMKALKEGRILITECDEFDEWRPDPNRDSQFLGCKLTSDRTLELLQKRSGAKVMSALVTRDGKQNYTCSFTPVPVPGSTPVNMPLSDQCLRVLETSIVAHPEQWYQWKKFGKMVKSQFEVQHDRRASGYLAPETGVSFADQA